MRVVFLSRKFLDFTIKPVPSVNLAGTEHHWAQVRTRIHQIVLSQSLIVTKSHLLAFTEQTWVGGQVDEVADAALFSAYRIELVRHIFRGLISLADLNFRAVFLHLVVGSLGQKEDLQESLDLCGSFFFLFGKAIILVFGLRLAISNGLRIILALFFILNVNVFT